MDWDNDSYHSKSEFYYSDEENILQENKNFENTSKHIEDEEMSTIQEFTEVQRLETSYGINVWKRFWSSIGEARELENILLCKFFMDMKKKDGREYKPASLSSFQRSIQRYPRDKNSLINLFQDMEIAKAREVLRAKKESSSKSTPRDIAHKQQDQSQQVKKICCSLQNSSVTTTLRCSREPFGGFYPCTLASELVTSPIN